MGHHVVLLDNSAEATVAKLRALLPEGWTLSAGTARGDEHMKQIIADADFAIAGQVAVNADVLGAAKKLKLLQKWGVGYDNLDLEAARRLGIKVARTTGSNAAPVAEFTLGLMLSTLRQIAWSHMHMQAGVWKGGRMPRESYLLGGKTVGIVGFGAIGSRVAALLRGFECTVLYTQRTRLSPEEEAARGVRHASIDEIIEQADVISLHCPLTPATENLFNDDTFRRMKKTAVLVNVARGGVVDEPALARALAAREILAAAADVFADEPLPGDSPLIGIDHMVLTPHLAAGSVDVFAPTVLRMYRNMKHVADGEPVPAIDSLVD
jgi:phosphoglycerate dehydrogenase-like enzyme